MKRCLDCGSIGEWGRGGRCDTHRLELQRARERHPARRGRKAARYDADHRALRATWQAWLFAGNVHPCARCGEPIVDAVFDLDHLADGSSAPSHPDCNRSHGATHERRATA